MKKMLLGAHMPISGGFYKAAILGKEAGCSAIQIFTKSNRQWRAKPITSDDATLFSEQLKKSNIAYAVAHASYLINICSPDAGVEARSIEALAIELNRCHQLGIHDLVLHPGSRKELSEESAIKQAIKNINLVLEETPRNTRLLLETMAGHGSAMGHKLEQLSKIIKGVKYQDRIGVCLDTCHIFAAGYDIRSANDYDNLMASFENLIGISKLHLIHLNDSKKDLNSRVDRHENIGKGKIGNEAFSLIINDAKISHVPKVLETPKEGVEEDKVNLQQLVNLVKQENLNLLIGTNLEMYKK